MWTSIPAKMVSEVSHPSKDEYSYCCSNVTMSGVNGNVIMSGWGNDNPDNGRREAVRGNSKREELWGQTFQSKQSFLSSSPKETSGRSKRGRAYWLSPGASRLFLPPSAHVAQM